MDNILREEIDDLIDKDAWRMREDEIDDVKARLQTIAEEFES